MRGSQFVADLDLIGGVTARVPSRQARVPAVIRRLSSVPLVSFWTTISMVS